MGGQVVPNARQTYEQGQAKMSFTRISRNAVAIVLAAGIVGLTLYAVVATAGIALVAIANFARLLLG